MSDPVKPAEGTTQAGAPATPPSGTPATPPVTPATAAPGTLLTDSTPAPTPADPPAQPKEGEPKPGDKPPEPTPAAKPEVPEKYELKLPEGALLDQAQVDDIAAYAKEAGLSNDQAQRLLEREAKAVGNYAANQNAVFNKRLEEWATEVKNDKEVGGEGFAKNIELAKRVVDRFGDDSFKKQLNESGLGNHPGLVRLFVKIGRNMGEDSFVNPGSQVGGKKSREELFYGGTSNETKGQ